MTAKSIITLLRPQQWVKNLFVILPVFFGGRLFDATCWLHTIPVFIAFCIMASAIYCMNDARDADDDRRHPVKCRRPVASGAISVSQAYMLMLMLATGSFATAWIFSTETVAWILLAYLAINTAYSAGLKHIAIADVFIVATGFVLRVAAGGVACGIWLSPWIMCMTFLLALFLAFAKRRDDVVLHDSCGITARRSIAGYNTAFMNQTLGILATITMVCYIMYSLSPEVMQRLSSEHVYITSVFVLAALLRYLQIALVEKRSGSPTAILLHDRFIQGCIAIWLATFALIIY